MREGGARSQQTGPRAGRGEGLRGGIQPRKGWGIRFRGGGRRGWRKNGRSGFRPRGVEVKTRRGDDTGSRRGEERRGGGGGGGGKRGGEKARGERRRGRDVRWLGSGKGVRVVEGETKLRSGKVEMRARSSRKAEQRLPVESWRGWGRGIEAVSRWWGANRYGPRRPT